MDEKKKLLLRALDKLTPYRDAAEGVIAVVESEFSDDETITGLIAFVQSIIVKMRSWDSTLATSLKNSESKEREKDLQEAEELLQKTK